MRNGRSNIVEHRRHADSRSSAEQWPAPRRLARSSTRTSTGLHDRQFTTSSANPCNRSIAVFSQFGEHQGDRAEVAAIGAGPRCQRPFLPPRITGLRRRRRIDGIQKSMPQVAWPASTEARTDLACLPRRSRPSRCRVPILHGSVMSARSRDRGPGGSIRHQPDTCPPIRPCRTCANPLMDLAETRAMSSGVGVHHSAFVDGDISPPSCRRLSNVRGSILEERPGTRARLCSLRGGGKRNLEVESASRCRSSRASSPSKNLGEAKVLYLGTPFTSQCKTG